MGIRQSSLISSKSLRKKLGKLIPNRPNECEAFPGISKYKAFGDFYWDIDANTLTRKGLKNIYDGVIYDIEDDDNLSKEEIELQINELKHFVSYLEKRYIYKEGDVISTATFIRIWKDFRDDNISWSIKGDVYSVKYSEYDNIVTVTLTGYDHINDRRCYLTVLLKNHLDSNQIPKVFSYIKVDGYMQQIETLQCDKKVQIIGNSFEVLSSEPQVYEKWEKEINSLNLTKKHFIDILPKKIHLIANLDGNGYSDFMNIINKNYDFEIIAPKRKYTLSVDNIVNEIDKINQKSSSGFICILRGGGNPYDLIQFSSPKVCEAIANSPLPVVIGVGHSKDKNRLLCNEFTYETCITPSEAARFFIDLYNNWKQQ